jgi:hypothetical protein
MIRWIRNWWYAKQRAIDMDILWPTCLKQAPDLNHAKAAFAYHCFTDPAWLVLSDKEIVEFIDSLEAYD